jgi:hypothetical protein
MFSFGLGPTILNWQLHWMKAIREEVVHKMSTDSPVCLTEFYSTMEALLTPRQGYCVLDSL